MPPPDAIAGQPAGTDALLLPATAGAIGAFSILIEPQVGQAHSPAATSRSNDELEPNQPSNSWPLAHFTV
jgi:hypothetical protein